MEFEQPEAAAKEVISYRSRHDAGWTDMFGRLSGSELRALCERPLSQHSMRLLNSTALLEKLSEVVSAEDSTGPFESRLSVRDGHRVSTVRVRRGQAAFRRHLLDRFGATCAISGPQPETVLDAAHLYRYADIGVHHYHGGLLLRKDIHTLFDLGHIAVSPASLLIDVSTALADRGDYRRLHGRPLAVAIPATTKTWLSEHWNLHRNGT